MEGALIVVIILAIYSLLATVGILVVLFLYLKSSSKVTWSTTYLYRNYSSKATFFKQKYAGSVPHPETVQTVTIQSVARTKEISKSKLQTDLERQKEHREKAIPLRTIGMTQSTEVGKRTHNSSSITSTEFHSAVSSTSSDDTIYNDVITKTPDMQVKLITWHDDSANDNSSNADWATFFGFTADWATLLSKLFF